MTGRPADPGLDAALFDANEYLIAGLENQAEWWEHLGDAHRDYAALARVAVAQEAELSRLREERDAARGALEAVRRECDLPEHIAEIVGDVLATFDDAVRGVEARGRDAI